MRCIITRSAPVAATAALSLVIACARNPAPSPTAAPAASGAAAPAPSGATTAAADTTKKATAPKPYEKVVTADAKTRAGLFITHRIDDKLYFELPRRELNRDLLLVGRYRRAASAPGDFEGYGGDEFKERVVRWERMGNRVLLRSPSFEITADSTLPVSQAVVNSSYPPIIAAFDVEAYGRDSAPVIDVTRLYTTAIPEFVAIKGTVDEKRSFVERVAAFPDNIEVEATQTATPTPGDRPPGPFGQPPSKDAQSVSAHWSMIRLPEQPMMPRLFDDRVGYFSVGQVDFGRPEQKSVRRVYITRYRLAKKDPDAALSEPVNPIVYYIDPATPKQWAPWIKRGIEEWQVAFEAAGFKHAIIARDAPSPAEDPDWSPEDVRHTVVRWLSSTVENAVGPHVHDPRTGEILNGSVRFFHNVMNLLRDWYFVQAGALDPRVRTLPMPDSLMGRLIQFVVAHEVGHTLGFQHNMKASAEYPADSVRSASWVHRMGHTPTLMDYARFNYVAQPEDRIDLADLVPRVGPYDAFATMWGYKPIAGARTPDQEKPTLDRWARMQDTVPWYRFSTSGAKGSDPGDEIEAVGDADAVRSTALGLKNIRRIVPLVIPATVKNGENNDDLREIYERLVGQWALEVEHVANVVGGAESQEKYGGQAGPRFTAVSRARQVAAVQFLDENVFRTPTYLVDAEIVRRLEPEGSLSRISDVQAQVLRSLLDNGRLTRMIEFEALAHGKDCYMLGEMLSDVRRAIWAEVSEPRITIDPFRQNLQHAFFDQVNAKLNPAAADTTLPAGFPQEYAYFFRPAPQIARSMLRGELLELDQQLASAVARASDRETRYHLIYSRHRIEQILNPVSPRDRK